MFFEPKIYSNVSSGSVEVICGSMFSGKTEELMRRLRRAEIARMSIAIFKPKVDSRYDKGHIVSHDKTKMGSFIQYQLVKTKYKHT